MTNCKKLIINVPVADLRKEPVPLKISYNKDLLQETQLLYGECLLASLEKNGWIFVEAIEQQCYRKNEGWTGYPGWIKREQAIEISEFPDFNLVVNDLWAYIFESPNSNSDAIVSVSLGSKLEGIELLNPWWRLRLPGQKEGYIAKGQVRQLRSSHNRESGKQMVSLGEKLLGHPYLWGGRSIYRPGWLHQTTSLDCSGLTDLLYRVNGIAIPRDAHDQFLKTERLEFQDLQVGDLVFLFYHDKPARVGHVMIYAGGDGLLDANITDGKVVKTTAKERYGKPFREMRAGDDIGVGRIYFGKRLSLSCPCPCPCPCPKITLHRISPIE